MFFIFVAQINVIFMRPLYEANIFFDCIIKISDEINSKQQVSL